MTYTRSKVNQFTLWNYTSTINHANTNFKTYYQTHMTMQVLHTNGLALSKNLDTKIQEKYHHSNHAPDIPIHILTSQPH